MVHVVVEASKYLMILFVLVYTFTCFYLFRFRSDIKKQGVICCIQRIIFYLFHFDAFLVLYFTMDEPMIPAFYLMQVVFFTGIFVIYRIFYKQSSFLLLNNMCMLLTFGFIMLTRISYTKSLRQFIMALAGTAVAMMVPLFLQVGNTFRKLTWLYAGVGIAALAVVAVIGNTEYGAKLSISIAGISIQPSEFVKILFVFFIASMLRKDRGFRRLLITSVFAAMFVLLLALSKDLGGALLYFVTYLTMVYVATKKWYYFAGGGLAMAVAAIAGSQLFSHVQKRVMAWKDPLSVYETAGFQVSQSLFAIGTGGWFGMGLNQGLPTKIPVVTKDFIFSAISEEMGGIIAICLILICLNCFLMFMNIAMQLKDEFYKLVALGLGTLYAMQVFLMIGGVIKFIPSTGVTLPLVSYGGSSLISTLLIFGVIQGLYIPQNRVLVPVEKTGKEAS